MVSYHYKNPREHALFARDLHKQMPKAERMLWKALQRQPEVKFRRQHPLHPYIVDFTCIKARLIVELDGTSHDSRNPQTYDRERDLDLRGRGWMIVRFINDDVERNLNGVVLTIFETAQTRLPALPCPSRKREGCIKHIHDFE